MKNFREKTTAFVFCFIVAASSAQAACAPDGSPVTATGVVKVIAKRDKHTGRPYTYVALQTEVPYCLSGPDMDASNFKPTFLISIANKGGGNDAAFRKYAGRHVIVHGTLESTNGGGPLLFYTDVAPR